VQFRGFKTLQRKRQAKTEEDLEQLVLSGIRYVGDIILYNKAPMEEDYINHSDNPNILYHCGLGISCRGILAREELLLDYRLFLPHGESFINIETNTEIHGFSSREALLQSTQKLLQLLEKNPEAPHVL